MQRKSYSILFTAPAVLFMALFIFSACKLIRPAADRQPESFNLRFNDGGKFKISQFTDIHWENDSVEKCASTARLIRHVLKEEHPSLAVLTGDIVIQPSAEGWKAVTALFTEAGIPFAVVMGNHDDEAEWSRDRIFDFLETVDRRIHISLMSQYHPFPGNCDPEYPELNRTLRTDEYQRVVEYARNLGFKNLMVQEMESHISFLPDFDRDDVFNG